MSAPASRVYGLRPPEKKIELDVGKLTQKQLIRRALRAYRKVLYTPDVLYMGDNEVLYRMACDMVRPFRDRISGTLTRKDTAGYSSDLLFLSAMLNETAADRLDVENSYGGYIGYRLRPGKSVIIHKGATVCTSGTLAEGGIAINNGHSDYIGEHASNGLHINNGTTHYFGCQASGGMFFNFGKLKEEEPAFDEFPSHGGDMASLATGGIFVSKHGSRPCDKVYDNDLEKSGWKPYNIFTIVPGASGYFEPVDIHYDSCDKGDPLLRMLRRSRGRAGRPTSRRSGSLGIG
jgi:hypothetical protein